MRRLAALALVAACGGNDAPDASAVSLVLDIPNGMLDPQGYTSVDLVLHERTGDVTRTASITEGGSFALDRIDPSASVAIEATLRNQSGAAVGYGRTAIAAALAEGAQITVPVRRPIAYFAGPVSRDADGNPDTAAQHWTLVPATYSDLSSGAPLDGQAQVGSNVVLVVAAGPSLYAISQSISDPGGTLTGAARVTPIAAADHQAGSALAGAMTGAVLDGAGSDDGATLVIGTASQLSAIDTASGAAHQLADGSFARVALVASDTGELAAVAIRNRGGAAGPCASSAELWWATLTGAGAGAGRMIATGGFADVAGDRGHAYYVDACTGELGEVTAAGARVLRTLPGTGGTGGAGAGRPTALAVSNGQAYVGVESPPASASAPATASLLVVSIATGDAARTLWSEGAQQVLDVRSAPEARRQLNASSVVFGQLEVGAGGDYVALTTSAHFHGARIPEVSFPETTVDTEELRVFDAVSGGVIQRYRSWCDGVVIRVTSSEIGGWECAAATGQSAPASDALNHHISSMTFLLGKK